MSLDWKTFKNHYKINNFTKSFNDFSENQTSVESTTNNINLNKINNVDYNGLGNNTGDNPTNIYDVLTAKKIIVNEDTASEYIDSLNESIVVKNKAFNGNVKFLFFGSYYNLPAIWASGTNNDNYDMIINPPQGDPSRVGNVGIGVAEPQTTLDVNGAIQANNSISAKILSTSGDTDIVEIGNNEYGARLLITDSIDSSPRWEIFNNQNASLDFTLNQTQYMKVYKDNMFIEFWTNIRTHNIDVDDSDEKTIPNIKWVRDNDLWEIESSQVQLKNDKVVKINNLEITDMLTIKGGLSGLRLASLNSSPTFTGTVTAPSFTATSDKNKKENIETISDATSKIESLRGVSYNLKTDNTKTHYGVVAQELEEVFPDMVHGEEGNKSVAYMEIIGVLIETVKDLNKRVKILEQTSNN